MHKILLAFLFIGLLSTLNAENSGEGLLLSVVSKVSGVFRDPKIVKKYDLERTVFVAAANYGYLNHLFNFDCFVRKLGMKYMIASLDRRLHNYLTTRTNLISYYFLNNNHAAQSNGQTIGTNEASFRSKQFNLIATRKKEIVYKIMKLGYNVLFSDVDVALLHDPFPYLLWSGVNYVHSLNNPCRM